MAHPPIHIIVENGDVTRAVRNLRFTQSYLEALNQVDMIGSEGCMPDGVVTILDATATVTAFQGQPNLCPGPCH